VRRRGKSLRKVEARYRALPHSRFGLAALAGLPANRQSGAGSGKRHGTTDPALTRQTSATAATADWLGSLCDHHRTRSDLAACDFGALDNCPGFALQN